MQTRTIALVSANEAAITAASHQLLEAAAGQRVQLALLQGVTTALEAEAVYSGGGELWALGADATDAYPELTALVDRTIEDGSPQLLDAGVDQAFRQFVGKTRIAA